MAAATAAPARHLPASVRSAILAGRALCDLRKPNCIDCRQVPELTPEGIVIRSMADTDTRAFRIGSGHLPDVLPYQNEQAYQEMAAKPFRETKQLYA